MAGLTKKEATEVETLRQAVFLMSANQQYRLAFMIAENIGFMLKSNDPLSELSRDAAPLSRPKQG